MTAVTLRASHPQIDDIAGKFNALEARRARDWQEADIPKPAVVKPKPAPVSAPAKVSPYPCLGEPLPLPRWGPLLLPVSKLRESFHVSVRRTSIFKRRVYWF